MRVKSTDFFGRLPINLYYRMSPTEVQWFADLMSDFPEIGFHHPDWRGSPWHVQGELPNGVVMDFWPHTTKGKVQYTRNVEDTVAGICSLVEQQLDAEECHVVEFFDKASYEDIW